jgi:hypothetical protein
MKTKALFASFACLALSTLVAGSARAVMIAGWDFSQYAFDGAISIDGSNLTNRLDANYSNLDPSFGAGNQTPPVSSANFGTMYIDGSFGSSTTPLDFTDPFVPTTGSLVSNLNAGVPGSVPFDSHVVLDSEGQAFSEFFSMTTTQAFMVVFEARLTAVPDFGTDWVLSFGGRTFAGNTSVGVEFSTDGTSYSSVGSANLTTVDTPFTLNLGAAGTDNAFVRLSFAAPGGGGLNQARIDNVAISATLVPEPGTAALLLAGLIGLARAGRRRS